MNQNDDGERLNATSAGAKSEGAPAESTDADKASMGATEAPDTIDENDRPVDNPSG